MELEASLPEAEAEDHQQSILHSEFTMDLLGIIKNVYYYPWKNVDPTRSQLLFHDELLLPFFIQIRIVIMWQRRHPDSSNRMLVSG